FLLTALRWRWYPGRKGGPPMVRRLVIGFVVVLLAAVPSFATHIPQALDLSELTAKAKRIVVVTVIDRASGTERHGLAATVYRLGRRDHTEPWTHGTRHAPCRDAPASRTPSRYAVEGSRELERPRRGTRAGRRDAREPGGPLQRKHRPLERAVRRQPRRHAHA